MRLVIDSRGSALAGLKRYKGEGIYSSIGRKVLLSGLRQVINTLEKGNHSQKVADFVVNGHRKEDSSSIKKKVVSTPQAGVKRKSSSLTSSSSSSSPQPTQSAKARRYSNSTTEKFVNSVGPGILRD